MEATVMGLYGDIMKAFELRGLRSLGSQSFGVQGLRGLRYLGV